MVEHLFRPLKIGAETLPNRVCFLGHRTNLAAGGRIGDRLVEYYRRRAAGGCGLIIVGEFSIHDGDWPWASMINAHGPDTVHDFRRLTEAIQAHGTAACARLCHHGFQSNGCISRREVWGPSAVADVAFGETAKVMELEDIAVVRDAFARAAERAREGGFSGVEIDMGPESLLRQFLSPMSNQREDEYGGSLENRMRLPLEVVESVRAAVGNDFTVGLRLCADEMFWGGIGPEESVEFARRFEQSGMVDFLDIAVGTYYNLHLVLASMHTPTKFAIEATAAITGAVAIPTIATTQIAFPALADEIVAQGQAAVAGVVRPLIADPDAPRKAQEGRLDDIRYCIRDNFCVGRV
ncbi:MAG: mycofactocin system FadH/OYE family oxidoreductase 2, partial [Deltaproteobacteria bacterium]|nr:mycofactocin system FadH/OYE family oxidoreductase 2 [Candidatus Anaeroferrophillacea bacterium]